MRFWFALLLVAGCHAGSAEEPQDPPLGAQFVDHFDRADVGSDYRNTGAPWRIEDGKLVVDHAHNHPLWLKRRLPRDVKVEVDVMSRSPRGDVKVEVFGDGFRHESAEDVRKDAIYEASGYVFIFGGWSNSRSVLVRKQEHAWQFDSSVPLRTTPRVEANRTYHWEITRQGKHVDWKIDGQPFLSWDDPNPLEGAGQDHFAFDGWETEIVFDNLVITAL